MKKLASHVTDAEKINKKYGGKTSRQLKQSDSNWKRFKGSLGESQKEIS